MYSTCLYCAGDLGSNAVIEELPIGRRIAFDAAQGRLWVVCRRCEKWNLVPFDSRLEAIDRCEQLFADARLRYSTGNIGIARLLEGLELVRIGPARRAEFAAWRYGDQFGRRRRRDAVRLTVTGTAIVAVGLAHSLILPLLGGSALFPLANFSRAIWQRRRAVVRIPERDGVGGVMTHAQLDKVSISVRDRDRWTLTVPLYEGTVGGFATGMWDTEWELDGAAAITALGRILPRVNGAGASRQRVGTAVTILEAHRSVPALIGTARRVRSEASTSAERFAYGASSLLTTGRFTRPDVPPLLAASADGLPLWIARRLSHLPPALLLALEMLAHEDAERAALAGELKLLEREWKAAEELATISDALAVSDEANEEFHRRAR